MVARDRPDCCSRFAREIVLLRAMIDRTGKPIRLEIDGGVKADNIAQIAAAGADTFVAGSAIFNAPRTREHYAGVVGQMKAAVAAVR